MKIIGAGLAGLLAGNLFPLAEIIEAGPASQMSHKAVLRFRSKAVGDAVGIDFREVTVHKGLWMDGQFVQPSILLANRYSRKVIGKLADRSVWNLEPSKRFIAPEDFVHQLGQRCHTRVRWDTPISSFPPDEPCISTIPMSLTTKMVNAPTAPDFKFAQIVVMRWKVKNSDVFQTVYFPDPDLNLYRASITGDLLIAEFMYAPDTNEQINENVMSAFGLTMDDVEPIDSTKQRFGKISPIDDAWRRGFIFRLTRDHDIYSLGRFATWRNILLDDVLKDIYVIKKLLNTDPYAARIIA